MLAEVMRCSAVGSKAAVEKQMQAFIAAAGADELMIASPILQHQSRLRSFEIVAEISGR